MRAPAGRPSSVSQAGELASAALWLDRRGSADWGGESMYEQLFHLRALDYSSVRILDVGSGPISVFEPVAPPGAQVVPYDTLAESYERLAPAKKFPIRAELPREAFSVIAILNCLDHMDAPAELLTELTSRLADTGEVWIYCNIGQPYDPALHPQNFSFHDLIALTEQSFRIRRCGLVREGRLFPYAWWAVCGPARTGGHRRPIAMGYWTLRCRLTFLRFHAVRAAVKVPKLAGLRRLLPKDLQF